MPALTHVAELYAGVDNVLLTTFAEFDPYARQRTLTPTMGTWCPPSPEYGRGECQALTPRPSPMGEGRLCTGGRGR